MTETYALVPPDFTENQPPQTTPSFQPIKYSAGSMHQAILEDSVYITSSTSDASSEAFIHRLRLSQFKNKYTPEFLRIIFEENFEYGFNSLSDLFVKQLMEMNDGITREWLNSIYRDYWHDARVFIGLLHVISHLEYEQICPEGPTMAMAALYHPSVEVRECGIRAFENWGASESLSILRNFRCDEKWLQEYVEQVVSDLEEELGGNVSAC